LRGPCRFWSALATRASSLKSRVRGGRAFPRTAGEAIGEIAVTFSLPTDYRTFQLKGRHAMAAEPDSSDLAAVERHRDAFGMVNEQLGQPRQRVEAFWRAEIETSAVLVKVFFVPEHVFDQTPGPGAGRRL